MAADDVDEFWEAITVIEAQQALLAMQIGDYPHLKKDDRSKMSKSISRQAHPRGIIQQEDGGISIQDAARLFHGG